MVVDVVMTSADVAAAPLNAAEDFHNCVQFGTNYSEQFKVDVNCQETILYGARYYGHVIAKPAVHKFENSMESLHFNINFCHGGDTDLHGGDIACHGGDRLCHGVDILLMTLN